MKLKKFNKYLLLESREKFLKSKRRIINQLNEFDNLTVEELYEIIKDYCMDDTFEYFFNDNYNYFYDDGDVNVINFPVDILGDNKIAFFLEYNRHTGAEGEHYNDSAYIQIKKQGDYYFMKEKVWLGKHPKFNKRLKSKNVRLLIKKVVEYVSEDGYEDLDQ